MTPPRSPRTAGIVLAVSLATLALSGCSGSGGGTSLCPGFGSPGKGSGASVTVTGTVAYEDKVVGPAGFTGATPALPVREATVEVVRCSDGVVLGSDVLNDAGAFSVDAANDGAVGAFVRVLAKIEDAAYGIAVQDTHDAVYAMEGDAFDERVAPPQAFTATVAAGSGPPFNILDNALAAVRFVEDNLGLASPLQSVTYVWEADTTDFTAFLPTPRKIYVLDQPNAPAPDTDGYDDMVIRHETGHFIADQISKDDSPGGFHAIGDTDQDARLAWSEGWANFFGGAVAGNPDYADTFDPDVPGDGLFFSMEASLPGGGGAASELGVTATLWDALDGTPGVANADSDASVLGPGPILAAFAALAGDPDPVEFGAFWNALRSDPANAAGLADFQNAAQLNEIDLFEDDGTDDDPATGKTIDTPISGVPTTADANLAWDITRPSTGDVDNYKVVLVAGTTYTIRTTGLTDGADTYLQVLDAAGAPLVPTVTNDNTNGACYDPEDALCKTSYPPNDLFSLASRVFFTPPADGTYVVQVSRAPVPPPSAGLFGGYTLQISR